MCAHVNLARFDWVSLSVPAFSRASGWLFPGGPKGEGRTPLLYYQSDYERGDEQ